MSKIIFSFIMATFNSEKTIEFALKSIREQEFNQDEIEIIVIDGNSQDQTRNIALKYGCRIIDNPRRLPEPAKMIGLKAAVGEYICIMDSDEALIRKTILTERLAVLRKHEEVKCLSIGLKTPRGVRPCSYYINEVGDPFTCFVYRTYKDGMNKLIIQHGRFDEECKSYIGNFQKGDVRPIGDSGTVMELAFIKDNYSDILEQVVTATIFDNIISDTGYTACVNEDNNIHYSNFAHRF